MFNKGLKDVVAVQTNIASVDGEKGELRYRGIRVDELNLSHTFEEMAYFIWQGSFPNEEELSIMKKNLLNGRQLPEHMLKIIDALPADIELMDAVRTAISAFATSDFRKREIKEQAILLTAALPVIIARHYRNVNGLEIVDSREDLGHTANYLWMLTGDLPQKVHVDALETYLKLTMEHGMNASTFAARVTISTESDLTAAITSALGTMKGPLHGGAPSGVIDLLEEMERCGDIHSVVEAKLKSRERIMGFGHRVYQTEDPRSILLREACMQMTGQDEWLDLATSAESEIIDLLAAFKPGRQLYTNVEYYAAAIMRAIDMSPELFTPTFSAARIVGWTAHSIEQLGDNVIFRPQSEYVGDLHEVKL